MSLDLTLQSGVALSKAKMPFMVFDISPIKRTEHIFKKNVKL